MPALIVPAIMAATSAYSAYKTGKAASAAQKASEAQMGQAAGLGNQQAALAGREENRANQLFQTGMPQAMSAGNYWQTLLGGNRAAMAQATAGPRGALTDQYRGAERGLERSGIRGGARDLATAQLSRDRAGQIAGLTTGVQPGAAANLAGLGTSLIGAGTQNLGLASSTLGGAGSLFGHLAGLGQQGYQFQQGRSDEANAALGRSLFELLNAGVTANGKRTQQQPLPSRQTTPTWGTLPAGSRSLFDMGHGYIDNRSSGQMWLDFFLGRKKNPLITE